MLWAQQGEKKVLASPNSQAVCPCCGNEVIPKCGQLISWHWAHKNKDCDSWHEPESQWHLDWKGLFPKEWQEKVIGPHRADVATPRGIIEFQNSPLSVSEIKKREDFYGRMIWIVNARKFKQNLRSYQPYWARGLSAQDRYFRWRWPRKAWLTARQKVYLDVGGGELYCITGKYGIKRTYITASFYSKSSFVKRLLDD